MINLFSEIITAFILGLLTPLTAVCVLPLYPGFLSYLTNQIPMEVDDKTKKKMLAYFGILITLGVIIFMLIMGLIFTALLKISLTKVIGIISPIAFIILLIISLLLIFNIDTSKFFAFLKFRTPAVNKQGKPYRNSFIYGFFFGAIVVPCNPLFIAALFTRILGAGFFSGIISFLAFGIGIGFPLLIFSLISTTASTKIISFLTKYKRIINLITGLAMLIISIYYLLFVFNILRIF